MYACSPVPVGARMIALTLFSNILAFAETFSRVVGLADVMPTLARSIEISFSCVSWLATDVIGCGGVVLLERADILALWNFLIYASSC